MLYHHKAYKLICITNMMVELSPELAEICGIHAGDGYMRLREKNRGEVDISGHLEERDYYDNHVIPLFNNVFNLGISGKAFSRGSYGFITSKKEVRDALLSLDFPAGKKSKIVRVPKAILESKNIKLYGAFLRGLFDTDGNLYFRKSYVGISNFNKKYNHYPIIKLTTISRFLAEDIIKMLHEMDIIFYYSMFDPKKTNENREYLIIVNGVNGLEKWMELIGIKNPVKLSRYLIWKKFGFCPPHTTLQQREDILKGKLDIYSIGSSFNG